MRNGQWIVAAIIVVATVGIGVTISSRVDAQTRVDPATGALIGAARPSALTTAPPRTTAAPRGKVDWQGAVGGLRRSGGA